MNKERQLLAEVFDFFKDKQLISSDVSSINDMFERYANPPFTKHYRAAMRLTVTDTTRYQALMRKIRDTLEPEGALEAIADDH